MMLKYALVKLTEELKAGQLRKPSFSFCKEVKQDEQGRYIETGRLVKIYEVGNTKDDLPAGLIVSAIDHGMFVCFAEIKGE